jgi:type II secretory pathway pseudopilin PulG
MTIDARDGDVERMKEAFSLVELIIIVAVLGILAAIVVPQFQEHSVTAKESVAKDSLRILRSAIELYAVQHGGVPPGYPDDNPQNGPDSGSFEIQLTINRHYMSKLPENPFNNLRTIRMIGNGEPFPTGATGQFGWVYQPATMTIRLDWTGRDNEGVRYFDY